MVYAKSTILLSCSLALSACGGSDDNSNPEVNDDNVEQSVVALQIQSKDYFTGEFISNAEINISSLVDGVQVSNTGVTDENGLLSIEIPENSEQIVINGDADEYGEYSLNIASTDQAVDLFLQPVNASVSFDPYVEANLEVETINIVTLPANSLVDEDGIAPTGSVVAEITIIDPSTDPDLMPGDFQTIDSTTGVTSQIESFGAVNVTFDDEDGNSYNIAEGETATVRIPLASGSTNAPDTIPLYHFNETTGFWDEDGTATLNEAGTYYEGTVSHFSTWNADRVYDSIEIEGCLVNSDGDAVSGARVQTQGVDYSGQSVTYSNDSGNFNVFAKSNSEILLSATENSGLSRTQTLNTAEENIVQTECMILEQGAAVVTLTWGENPRDLDTQFFGPSAAEGDESFLVYFSNKDELLGEDENTATISLDVDDTSSYGPEVTTISSFPYEGRYTYAVKHYSGSSDIAASPARVELNFENETQIFSPPTGEATICWAVFDFVVDAQGIVTIEELATWESDSYCRGYDYEEVRSVSSLRSVNFQVDSHKTGLLQDMVNSKYYSK